MYGDQYGRLADGGVARNGTAPTVLQDGASSEMFLVQLQDDEFQCGQRQTVTGLPQSTPLRDERSRSRERYLHGLPLLGTACIDVSHG